MRPLWFRLGVVAAVTGIALGAAPPYSSAVSQRDPWNPAAANGFVVVVNDQNTVTSMPRALVSRFFLKKALRWDSGAVAQPVDLPANSPVREAFTRAVLSKSVASVKAYWQQQIFSGREVPPPEKPTDDAVLEFVRTTPAAIAYVSPSSTLPRGVRVLDIAD